MCPLKKKPTTKNSYQKLRKTVLPRARHHTITAPRHKLLESEKGRTQCHLLTYTTQLTLNTKPHTHSSHLLKKETHVRAILSCKHSPKPCQLAHDNNNNHNNNNFDSHTATLDESIRKRAINRFENGEEDATPRPWSPIAANWRRRRILAATPPADTAKNLPSALNHSLAMAYAPGANLAAWAVGNS